MQHAAIVRRLAQDAAKGQEDDQGGDLGRMDRALRKRVVRVLVWLVEDPGGGTP